MNIDRDDRDERQARLQLMIDDFQAARRRQLVRGGERSAESHTDAGAVTAVAGPATSL